MEEKVKATIGTDEEVFWTGVKERAENQIKESEGIIKVHAEIVKTAKLKIAIEKKKGMRINRKV